MERFWICTSVILWRYFSWKPKCSISTRCLDLVSNTCRSIASTSIQARTLYEATTLTSCSSVMMAHS